MSVLEKIRNKRGLLVGVLGVTILLFIVSSKFDFVSGNSLFGGDTKQEVGEINGKTIDYNTMRAKVDELLAIAAANNQMLDEQKRAQLVEQAWSSLVNELSVKSQWKELGLGVSDDELADLMLQHPHSFVVTYFTDQESGKVFEQFADAQGGLDIKKLNDFVGNKMTPEQEKYWVQLEEQVKEIRTNEKYYGLIKKGVYVTTEEAKFDYEAQNKKSTIRYAYKPYTAIADSIVKVSEEEILAYYNENQNEFKNPETTRKFEYLVWDAVATDEDIAAINTDMKGVAEEFKEKQTPSEDSLFMKSQNADGLVDIAFLKKNMISPALDSSVFTAAPGTVLGPYRENNTIKVAKLLGIKTALDSSKVRHILIAYAGSGASPTVKRSKDEAKKMADSLKEVLKKDRKKFDEYVKNYSDDGGKQMPPDKKESDDWMGKNGNYGWLNDMSGFVEPFKTFGLNGKKGDIDVVETNYGYHIMEILDVSKTNQTKYNLAFVTRKIEPSANTISKYYTQALDFASKNNTKELFDKAVTAQNLNKRVQESIKEGDKNIPGIDNPKELIRWVYEAEKGQVSSAFTFGFKNLVAVVTEIREKGIAPYEQVKEEVTLRAKKKKKSEQIFAEFKQKSVGSKTPEEAAAKLNVGVERMENFTFGSYNVNGINAEPSMNGVVSQLKPMEFSRPIKGQNSVFMVLVEKSDLAPTKDYKTVQKSSISTLIQSVEYYAYDALKELANIVDHKAKFDF